MIPELPVNTEVGLLGVKATPPVPDTTVHAPVPMEGVAAFMVVEPVQTV